MLLSENLNCKKEFITLDVGDALHHILRKSPQYCKMLQSAPFTGIRNTRNKVSYVILQFSIAEFFVKKNSITKVCTWHWQMLVFLQQKGKISIKTLCPKNISSCYFTFFLVGWERVPYQRTIWTIAPSVHFPHWVEEVAEKEPLQYKSLFLPLLLNTLGNPSVHQHWAKSNRKRWKSSRFVQLQQLSPTPLLGQRFGDWTLMNTKQNQNWAESGSFWCKPQ